MSSTELKWSGEVCDGMKGMAAPMPCCEISGSSGQGALAGGFPPVAGAMAKSFDESSGYA